MKPIWAEAANGSIPETEQAARFLAHTEGNLFDPKVLSYNATQVFKASDGEKNIVFMPVQNCQVWESLGINPEASELEVAASLKAIAHVLRFKALSEGQGEILFMCAHPLTQQFAEKHDFKKLEVPMYRMRLK